jgi:hypothetical protein
MLCQRLYGEKMDMKYCLSGRIEYEVGKSPDEIEITLFWR